MSVHKGPGVAFATASTLVDECWDELAKVPQSSRLEVRAALAVAFSNLALVEELGRFEAVAVEVGQKAVDDAVDEAVAEELWGEDQ